jgi:hypothetical protein
VTGPRLRVEGSAPSAPLRGLLAVAQVVDYDLPARWAAGIEIDRRPCGCAEVWALDCEGSGDNVKQADPLEPSTAGPRFDSFTVIWSDFCSTLGRAPTAEQEAAARENLTAVEGSAIEREFWGGGLLGAAPHLADASADEVAPPAGIVDALAALETAIGDSCRAGVIHATPAAGTWLARYGLVTLSGQRLVTTALGTPVAVGSGYPGTGPGGDVPPAGASWLYATGPVRIHRAPILVLQSIDQETNREVIRAEREVLVEWDLCLHAAVIAGHGEAVVPDAGSGS